MATPLRPLPPPGVSMSGVYTPTLDPTVEGTDTASSVPRSPEPHFQGKTSPGGAAAVMTPSQVRAMQQFLVNHGFHLAQDGIYGAQTKSAALAFRTNHKSADAWNSSHGIGVHAGNNHPPEAPPSNNTRTLASSTPSGASNTAGAFGKLLKQLLGQGGNVGTNFNATALGNAAAAPDDALAATLARQATQNPKDEAQHQADISNWYGLDPKAASYKLSVLGRLAQAKAANQTAATNTSGNDASLAAQLASSIGGSANDGSSSVAAAGANAAGTAAALGTEAADYANNMNPLLAAEATGAASKEKASNAQALLDLQDKLAAAQGQATADRANGAAGAQDKNNALGQQRFANKGNLLSTLAQMAAVDPNANALNDALKVAQINRTDAQTGKILTGTTGSGHVYKIDVGAASGSLASHLGYPQNQTGQYVVPTNEHERLAGNIAGYLVSQGFHPGDGSFKTIGDTIFNGFVDQHGRPLVAPPSWRI